MGSGATAKATGNAKRARVVVLIGVVVVLGLIVFVVNTGGGDDEESLSTGDQAAAQLNADGTPKRGPVHRPKENEDDPNAGSTSRTAPGNP